MRLKTKPVPLDDRRGERPAAVLLVVTDAPLRRRGATTTSDETCSGGRVVSAAKGYRPRPPTNVSRGGGGTSGTTAHITGPRGRYSGGTGRSGAVRSGRAGSGRSKGRHVSTF